MTTDSTPPVTDENHQPVRPLLPWRGLAAVCIVALMGLVVIWYMSNLRERANEARSETLSEKYGVTIKTVDPMLRDGEPVTWSVDGAERECVLSFESDTLRCETEDGSLVEVGK